MSINRLVISNIATGLETDRIPELIANDAFPRLNNAYIFRGRVLRKRGDQLLGRLQRDLTSTAAGTYSTINGTNTYSIFTGLGINVLEPDASVVLGNIANITIAFAAPISQSLTITTRTSTMTIVGGGPITAATLNYATGVITITASSAVGPADVTVILSYYPDLPVMGLEDFFVGNSPQPLMVGFDTRYSYQFDQGLNEFYDVNYYKTTGTHFTWNGEPYEQFWTTNYLGTTTILNPNTATGCMWATNGKPGFHFQVITSITNANPTVITTSVAHNLVTGDIVWFNENSSVDGIANLNGKSFPVTVLSPTTFSIPLNSAALTIGNSGIFVSMTSSGITPDQDGIRWYDGDPANGMAPHTLGWVNFSPPLNPYDPVTNPNPQYLVGAKMVLPFKNRLLFFGVYQRTSSSSPGVLFYPNRIVYSQVGTPFYSLPLPFDIQDASPSQVQVEAWYQSVAGRGGFIGAPISDQIVMVAENEDILLTLFETQPLKLIFTSDDTLPFVFQTVSAELGALSTFSGVRLDTGVLSVGTYGLTMCTSTSTQRIDLQIPDQVFDFGVNSNKPQKCTAIRDYQKEIVYFTYSPGTVDNKAFNSRTLLYNYRENNWSTLDENFTSYGTFRRTTNKTWSSIGLLYPTWAEWTDPWDFGITEAFFPIIVGGNQQGFVMQKGLSTAEQPSQFIQSITGTLITSPDHCLTTGDYILISGMLGSTNLNNTMQQITVQSADTFTINAPAIGTYTGAGVYARISIPDIQTKQFPIYWSNGRGARLGTSRFLFDTTPTGEITVNIFSSQNANTPSNDPAVNQYLVFTNTVLTSAEPSLYSSAVPPYESQQAHIWHRLSTSINGDTVQLGFTLNDRQMRDTTINQQDIVLHAICMDLYPGPILS